MLNSHSRANERALFAAARRLNIVAASDELLLLLPRVVCARLSQANSARFRCFSCALCFASQLLSPTPKGVAVEPKRVPNLFPRPALSRQTGVATPSESACQLVVGVVAPAEAQLYLRRACSARVACVSEQRPKVAACK